MADPEAKLDEAIRSRGSRITSPAATVRHG